VFKLSADGSTLLYSTFIGGRGNDRGRSIAADSSGNIYITGDTSSPDFPTVNAFNSTYGGGGDCFVLKLAIPPYYISLFYNAIVITVFNLIPLGLVLFTPVYLMRILISRPTTDITGIPPPDHKRLTCQLCGATYLYGPQHLTNPELLRCQNCNREFSSEGIRSPEETVPMSIVHVSVAYTLLSRLRESRWNIFRRKEESE